MTTSRALVSVVLAAAFAAGASPAGHAQSPSAAAMAEEFSLAEKGDPEAQFSLGVAYATGRGVPPDQTRAVSWYRKAAEQGYAHAQYVLGYHYVMGQGVERDYAQAAAWYLKAAEQGLPAAQHNLGISCHEGRGVPQDDVSAYMWLDLAASRSTGDEQKNFAEGRDAVATQMTEQQIADAERRAREWRAAFEKR